VLEQCSAVSVIKLLGHVGLLLLSLVWFCSDDVERGPERAAYVALTIATQRLADCLWIGAVLNREAEGDRRIARVRVGRAVRFRILQEQFADPTIGETADRCRVSQPADFEVERQRRSAVAQALAGYGTPPALSTASIASCAVSNRPRALP